MPTATPDQDSALLKGVLTKAGIAPDSVAADLLREEIAIAKEADPAKRQLRREDFLTAVRTHSHETIHRFTKGHQAACYAGLFNHQLGD